MENSIPKIKAGVSKAPLGAIIGVVGGYYLARSAGYGKSITVIPFMMVGLILGSIIASKL